MTNEEINENTRDKELAKISKEIKVHKEKSRYVDSQVVNKHFYNVFNFSRLPKELKHPKLTLGITSPNKGEGKTLVASNLAVSFALGYKRRTVLVDLNMSSPSIHTIFGISRYPGINESINNETINLVSSKIDQLYIYPAGMTENGSLGLDNIVPIRNIIYTLESEFDFIVIDMESILDKEFPALFANEVDRLLAVIDTESTKYGDLEKMYRYVNADQIAGYIFNNVDNQGI